MVIGIIDIGSNTVRLKIMDTYDDGFYRLLDEAKVSVRLGQGMQRDGSLLEEPMNQAIQTLKLFAILMERHNVKKVLAVATEAIRKATNQAQFLCRLHREIGYDIEIISGERESYLGYLGVVHTLPVKDFVLLDIGGGSAEIALVQGGEFKDCVSLPFGSVYMSEQYIDTDNPTNSRIEEMEKKISKAFQKLNWLEDLKGKSYPIIGLGGSIRSLAKIDAQRIGFPLDSIHNYYLDAIEMRKLYKTMATMKGEDIARDYPIGRDRSDIIVGGLATLSQLIKFLKANDLIISANGLREGLYFELYSNVYTKSKYSRQEMIDNCILNIHRSFGINTEHHNRVSELARDIFEGLRGVHGLKDEYLEYLVIAAKLHDIGNGVNFYNHHLHTAYLILNLELNGLRNREKVIIALITMLHRHKNPKLPFEHYSMLIDKDDIEAIVKCGLLLRISEMLDRSESGKVKNLTLEVGDEVKLTLESKDKELEVAAVQRVASRFKKVFRMELLVE